ncbi:MAG: RNA polymerase sigma factor [Clostridia bacterium]|nr:RNA polymerase sigma factor [Clostridia bacterium]
MSIFQRPKRDVEQAYEKYADLLYRVSFAQLASEADACDVVQDAFVRYMTAPVVFFSPEHEKAWLLRVTVNRCHDLHRRQKNHDVTPFSELEHVAAEDEAPYRELLDTVAALPEKFRSVVVLHALEGFSLQEVAQSLGISLSAAKMRWSRAREALKEMIQEE